MSGSLLSPWDMYPLTPLSLTRATPLHVDQPLHDQEGKGWWKSCPPPETNNPEIGA